MKKILLFFLCLTLLSACTTQPADIDLENLVGDFPYTAVDDDIPNYNFIRSSLSIQYSGGYIYFFDPISNMYPVLSRYNTQTGLITTICADPICQHNDPDCPTFGEMPCPYIYNNTLYARRIYFYAEPLAGGGTGEMKIQSNLISYDIENQHIEVLREYEQAGFSERDKQLYADHYRFYFEDIYNEELDAYVESICRMDLKTNEVLVLNNSANIIDTESGSRLLNLSYQFAINGRLYYTDGKALYHADYTMQNPVKVAEGKFSGDVRTNGEYIVWEEALENDPAQKKLYCMNLDGSNPIDLGITAWSWQITQNHIYYRPYNEVSLGKYVDEQGISDDLTLTGTEFYRCKLDGSEKKELTVGSDSMQIHSWLAVDNYMYCTFTEYSDPDGDGVYYAADCYKSDDNSGKDTRRAVILRVDLTTGEKYYINKKD